MKTLVEIGNTLSAFQKMFGFDALNVEQGSPDWLRLKLGVISASNASKVVAKVGSETRRTYMTDLVAQVCTGTIEEINSKYMEWGKQQESSARSAYEFENDLLITQVPFVFKDMSFREGCSPDGLVSESKGVEIKCPFNTQNFIKFLVDDEIKPEYVWQYQYTLRVMGADEWDFVQYDPRMKRTPMKTLTVKRDDEKQKILEDAVPKFIEEMDAMLNKIGIKFGEQWGLK